MYNQCMKVPGIPVINVIIKQLGREIDLLILIQYMRALNFHVTNVNSKLHQRVILEDTRNQNMKGSGMLSFYHMSYMGPRCQDCELDRKREYVCR